MLARTLSIVALDAGLAVTAAACSGAPPTPAVPTTAAVSSTARVVASTTTTTAPAPAVTGGSNAGPAAVARPGCPVTKATLLADWKADENGAWQVKHGATLGKPTCHAGYILVSKTSIKDIKGNPVADPEVAMFRYQSGSWRYRGASTADWCAGMPAAVGKYFESHFSARCGR